MCVHVYCCCNCVVPKCRTCTVNITVDTAHERVSAKGNMMRCQIVIELFSFSSVPSVIWHGWVHDMSGHIGSAGGYFVRKIRENCSSKLIWVLLGKNPSF